MAHECTAHKALLAGATAEDLAGHIVLVYHCQGEVLAAVPATFVHEWFEDGPEARSLWSGRVLALFVGVSDLRIGARLYAADGSRGLKACEATAALKRNPLWKHLESQGSLMDAEETDKVTISVFSSACPMCSPCVKSAADSANFDNELIALWESGAPLVPANLTAQAKHTLAHSSRDSEESSLLAACGRRILRADTDSGTVRVVCKDASPLVNTLSRGMQVLLPLLIDGASVIEPPDVDKRWFFYVALRRTGTLVQVVAYCSAYDFLRFPEGTRRRISQFAVLPFAQRSGIGLALYTHVVAHSRATVPDLAEITVEDPAPGFARVRLLGDLVMGQLAANAACNADTASLVAAKKPRKSHPYLISAVAIAESRALAAFAALPASERCALFADHASDSKNRTKLSDGARALKKDIERIVAKRHPHELPDAALEPEKRRVALDILGADIGTIFNSVLKALDN